MRAATAGTRRDGSDGSSGCCSSGAALPPTRHPSPIPLPPRSDAVAPPCTATWWQLFRPATRPSCVVRAAGGLGAAAAFENSGQHRGGVVRSRSPPPACPASPRRPVPPYPALRSSGWLSTTGGGRRSAFAVVDCGALHPADVPCPSPFASHLGLIIYPPFFYPQSSAPPPSVPAGPIGRLAIRLQRRPFVCTLFSV